MGVAMCKKRLKRQRLSLQRHIAACAAEAEVAADGMQVGACKLYDAPSRPQQPDPASPQSQPPMQPPQPEAASMQSPPGQCDDDFDEAAIEAAAEANLLAPLRAQGVHVPDGDISREEA